MFQGSRSRVVSRRVSSRPDVGGSLPVDLGVWHQANGEEEPRRAPALGPEGLELGSAFLLESEGRLLGPTVVVLVSALEEEVAELVLVHRINHAVEGDVDVVVADVLGEVVVDGLGEFVAYPLGEGGAAGLD